MALAVYLVRTLSRNNAQEHRPRNPTPDEVLEERVAKGELDENEFRRRRELLHGVTAAKS